MRLAYYILDVFTQQRFGGNPLAVVLDADALDGGRMQTIAREFNLSETVFVLQPQNKAHTARVRIFTTAAELPFAGHPTVGTAALLAQLRAPAGSGRDSALVVLEEVVGPVRVGVKLRPERSAVCGIRCPAIAADARGTATHRRPRRGARAAPVRDRVREPSPDAVRRRQLLHVRSRWPPWKPSARRA